MILMKHCITKITIKVSNSSIVEELEQNGWVNLTEIGLCYKK